MKNIEMINTYLAGKLLSTPTWLKYLIEADEIHQNYENVESLSELSTNSLLHYVLRTLESLERISVDEETYRIIETVLVYSEVAKGGSFKQRERWLAKGYNLMIHNEGSKSIYQEVHLAPYIKEVKNRGEFHLIWDLILTHGLIGQYIRGEARLDSHLEMINRFYQGHFSDVYTEEKLKNILYYLNLCIIEGVSPSLWADVKDDVKDVINGLFNGNVEPFSSRMHRLTHQHRETVEEKEKIMGDEELLVQNFLADKDLWYVEPAMHDLNFEDIWTIFLMIKDAVSDSKIHHIHFETLMQQLHYDFKGKKHNNVYRKRVIEKYLHEYRENKNPDNTHVSFHVEMNEAMQTAHVSFKFSAVGEALINFCVEAEKVDMMHNRANILLFDFFGLRKDAYDRFHNEEIYLEHMNSSADDKRIILDYVKGDTIVDVGPGGGVMLDMIEEETNGKEIYGIDISQNVIDSLKQKKQNESRSWDVIKGDALNLLDSFERESIDTIIYSSILHELYSYIRFEGNRFNHAVIKKGLKSAYAVLKPGGRIIIRDGIMTENKDLMRVIRFKDDNGMKFLMEYAHEFEGRSIDYKVISDDTVRMPINDAMEFLYTYTWGEESFGHEVQEQFGIFTPNEYKEFVSSIFGDTVKIIKSINYLQEGYTIHLKEKIDLEDEFGNSVALPDSTFFMVVEKIEQ
ncbi:class I SAM-dependent methyltransferase [Bacillus sp. NPDC094106]|uniref:class I SAM-dependent methyltransferase n=1 Tax=Bacillus sp. NPDC094106 TaxID=3363949 RepID=UPI0037F65FDC